YQIFPALPQPDPNLIFIRSPAGSGDFNGDGYPDLLTRVGTGCEVHYGRPDGRFDDAGTSLYMPPELGGTVIGDVNADTFDDLTALRYYLPPEGGRVRYTEAQLFLGGPAGIGETPDQIVALE